MDLKKLDLNDVDWSDPGGWPVALKVLTIIAACAALAILWYMQDTKAQLAQLEKIERQEQELKQTFQVKQNKAINLELYRDQMKEMERSFGAMLRQLPSKTEVAELLVDVSQTGLANGLEFELFKPQNEVPAEFYAELPIKIKVTGNYHEFGEFVSDVAALPRIVTLQDIVIKPLSSDSNSGGKSGRNRDKPVNADGPLVMEATAKTYRYLEDTSQ